MPTTDQNKAKQMVLEIAGMLGYGPYVTPHIADLEAEIAKIPDLKTLLNEALNILKDDTIKSPAKKVSTLVRGISGFIPSDNPTSKGMAVGAIIGKVYFYTPAKLQEIIDRCIQILEGK